jgi:hypothetical protein
MITAANLFGAYFSVGLLLMAVVVVSTKAKRRRLALETIAGADEISAAVLIFIALLWPIWLVYLLTKEKRHPPPNHE